MERIAGRVHRALNAAILIGAMLQFYTAGLALWGLNSNLHGLLGWSLVPLSVMAVGAAFATRTPRRARRTLMLAGLVVLQPTLVFWVVRFARVLAALHPLNGLAVVGLALWIEVGLRGPRPDKGGQR